MNVLTCIATLHDPYIVALAASLCAFGSWVTVALFWRVRDRESGSRGAWLFLSGLAAGATTWCTHFVAMLSYDPGTAYVLDHRLTAVSLVVAVAGSVAGIRLAAGSASRWGLSFGGAVVGGSVAAMHYAGMAGFHPDGIVEWDMAGVAASIVAAIGLGAASLSFGARSLGLRRHATSAGLLLLAIVSLHFTGMSAVAVTPLGGASSFVPGDTHLLAATVAAVGFAIMGAALAANTIETSSQRASLARLSRMAMHDALTGLPNRVSFGAQARREIAAGPVTLVGIDLDRFKEVNDLRGHAAGDEVLRALATRMSAVLLEGELVARIGGDEFAALKRGGDADEAAGFAERLRDAIRVPVDLSGGGKVSLDASLGFAVAPRDGTEFGDLVSKADLAMYRAKASAKANVYAYEAGMDEAARRRRALAVDLRSAVAEGQLEIHYQVQRSLDGDAVTGHEALLRWHHPERGVVSPAEFIPIAEETGTIVAIGEWVMRRACLDAARWPEGGRVAVNLSHAQFAHPDLAGMVAGALAVAGLPAARLEIELTESTLMGDPDRTVATLGAIRALGVTVAMDDFGIGYSSLSTLRSFRFDKIKLDRSFMAELGQDPHSEAVLRAVLTLGRSLDISVLAEGVETNEQLEFLRSEGCHEAQGFLLGRPEPIRAARGRSVADEPLAA